MAYMLSLAKEFEINLRMVMEVQDWLQNPFYNSTAPGRLCIQPVIMGKTEHTMSCHIISSFLSFSHLNLLFHIHSAMLNRRIMKFGSFFFFLFKSEEETYFFFSQRVVKNPISLENGYPQHIYI